MIRPGPAQTRNTRGCHAETTWSIAAAKPSVPRCGTHQRQTAARTPRHRSTAATFYTGVPWFLPLVSLWYRFRDRMAR